MDNYTIYSIFFKNSRYIGKTVNLARRQKIHRSDCFKINNPNYNLKVFRGLRELGITKNELICMPIITINNISSIEATKNERFWYDFFKADLNDDVPGRTEAERYQDNRESKLEYQNEYYQDNRDKILKAIDLIRELKVLPTEEIKELPSEEQLEIMQALFKLELIDSKGNATKEGVSCLYH